MCLNHKSTHRIECLVKLYDASSQLDYLNPLDATLDQRLPRVLLAACFFWGGAKEDDLFCGRDALLDRVDDGASPAKKTLPSEIPPDFIAFAF